MRYLFRQVYQIINIQHLELSREMELQADEVGARICGKQVYISALRRIDFGSVAFEKMLSSLDILSKEQKIVRNLFTTHRYYMHRLALLNRLPLQDGLPVIVDEDIFGGTFKSRVIFEDQWNSHPSLKTREKYINRIENTRSVICTKLAWELLPSPVALQEMCTQAFYVVRLGQFKEFEVFNDEQFQKWVNKKNEAFCISPIFRDFYEGRWLCNIDTQHLITIETDLPLTSEKFKEIYAPTVYSEFESIQIVQDNITVLQLIKDRKIKTPYVELNGQKYMADQAEVLVEQQENMLQQKQEKILNKDKEAFLFNYHLAKHLPKDQSSVYLDLFNDIIKYQSYVGQYEQFIQEWEKYADLEQFSKKVSDEDMTDMNRELSDLEICHRKFMKDLCAVFPEVMQRCPFIREYVEQKGCILKISKFTSENYYLFQQKLYEIFRLISEQHMVLVKEMTDFQKTIYKQFLAYKKQEAAEMQKDHL